MTFIAYLVLIAGAVLLVIMTVKWVGAFLVAFSLFSVAVLLAGFMLLLAYRWCRITIRRTTLFELRIGEVPDSPPSWHGVFLKSFSVVLSVLFSVALAIGDSKGFLPQYMYAGLEYGQEVFYGSGRTVFALFFLAPLNLGWALAVLHMPLGKWLKKSQDNYIDSIAKDIDLSLRRARNTLQKAKDIANELGCPYDYEPEWKSLIKGVSIIEERVTNLEQSLENDLSNLLTARDRCATFESRYYQIVDSITDRPSLAHLLDLLFTRYQAALGEYIAKRTWSRFFEAMDYLEEELRKALRVAEQNHADDNYGSGWRPGAMSVPQAHLILGTTPESAWSEITRAYRSKVKQVHPDQASGSIAKDDEFIKLVNLAMDTLKSTQSGG